MSFFNKIKATTPVEKRIAVKANKTVARVKAPNPFAKVFKKALHESQLNKLMADTAMLAPPGPAGANKTNVLTDPGLTKQLLRLYQDYVSDEDMSTLPQFLMDMNTLIEQHRVDKPAAEEESEEEVDEELEEGEEAEEGEEEGDGEAEEGEEDAEEGEEGEGEEEEMSEEDAEDFEPMEIETEGDDPKKPKGDKTETLASVDEKTTDYIEPSVVVGEAKGQLLYTPQIAAYDPKKLFVTLSDGAAINISPNHYSFDPKAGQIAIASDSPIRNLLVGFNYNSASQINSIVLDDSARLLQLEESK